MCLLFRSNFPNSGNGLRCPKGFGSCRRSVGRTHAFRRGSGSTDVGLRIMSLGTEKSTVHSDAELRVITIKTEAGDNVKYSGNPAELPGARFEITKALRRSGAFALLVEH